MGCALALVFQVRSLYVPCIVVHFQGSIVVRLYSEIDHTYLSIEAQCVSHHYPRWTATYPRITILIKLIPSDDEVHALYV